MFYLNKNEPSHPGGPAPSENGWIYLAYDQYKLDITKVGQTRHGLWSRLSTTTENPHYVVFAAFRVPHHQHPEIEAIEKWLRHKLYSIQIPHAGSTNKSEHVRVAPDDALGMVVGEFPNAVRLPRNEDIEYDFTEHVFLPEVNPFDADLREPALENYVQFASPAMYAEAVRSGYYKRPDFLDRVDTIDAREIYNMTGPDVLLRRLSYDLARRGVGMTGR